MTRFLHVGIDVSSKTLDVCSLFGKKCSYRVFDNTPEGHHALIQELGRRKSPIRVVMEATGIYHLELAFALHKADSVEVSVLNPRAFKHFATALSKRGKTDPKDAHTLAVYGQRMDFDPWQPPDELLMQVRSITRRMSQLAEDIKREKNRQHALERSVGVNSLVLDQILFHISELQEDLEQLEAEALRLVQDHQSNKAREELKLLQSIPGVGVRTSLVLWSELRGLPKDMTVRQWVAQCGLDVVEHQSGTSVWRRSRISKRGNKFIRRVLYLSALSAPKGCEAVARYRAELLERGKTPKQAAVAVMRKLLHSIYGMLRSGTMYDGEKFRARVAGSQDGGQMDKGAA